MKSSYSCYSFICLFLLIKDSFWNNSLIFLDKNKNDILSLISSDWKLKYELLFDHT